MKEEARDGEAVDMCSICGKIVEKTIKERGQRDV